MEELPYHTCVRLDQEAAMAGGSTLLKPGLTRGAAMRLLLLPLATWECRQQCQPHGQDTGNATYLGFLHLGHPCLPLGICHPHICISLLHGEKEGLPLPVFPKGATKYRKVMMSRKADSHCFRGKGKKMPIVFNSNLISFYGIMEYRYFYFNSVYIYGCGYLALWKCTSPRTTKHHDFGNLKCGSLETLQNTHMVWCFWYCPDWFQSGTLYLAYVCYLRLDCLW